MIVCLCLGISERHIQGVVAAGAQTAGDVARVCGAGTDCGACHQLVAALVEYEKDAACAPGDRK